ncbi:ABC transporter permease [Desertivirga brevis]|uniref:ABC transporter permease n=1 Tax=Desertivirga brevis TaxID=2810310 RepID=UPI001A96E67D|nr:ABC transporter permease [Pedobacter sp. SYSU D00873]
MNKILLIIQREYLSRVKKKSFIVMTFVVPLLFIGMYAVIGYMFYKKDDLTDAQKVLVIDDSKDFVNKFKNTALLEFRYSDQGLEAARGEFNRSSDDYLLLIPKDKKDLQLLGQKKPGIAVIGDIETQVNEIARTRQLVDAGIDTAVLNAKQTQLRLNTRQITEKGEEDASSWLAYGIGFVGAFLIYMSLFIYGVQVMRGVIEEKTNRIIEVIISSVKPFQLMLGKIVGVGLVGLTQFLLWIVLCLTIAGFAGTYFAKDLHLNDQNKEQIIAKGIQNDSPADEGAAIITALDSIPLVYTIGTFLFYFLFGFLLYSSIFAAVGSAVDSETETQQFMLPITMPLIFTFIISINFVINSPDSPLAFWLSIIPFTSPIAMMIRIPFGVPAWELILSMVLLVGGFLLITLVAARIYRVGILMYGKKASYKELIKWFSYKE